MYLQIIKQTRSKFEQVIEKLKEDFDTVRTGRASGSLVENIQVSYYGSTSPLKQMATISTPDATQILIQPWDRNSLGDIETAIRNSDLNLSPVNDGSFVRIALPPMTQERREELMRTISKKGEEGRIALRNVRGESWDEIKKMEKKSEVTEDDRYSAEKELNELIDEFNKKIEAMVQDKEKEIKTI